MHSNPFWDYSLKVYQRSEVSSGLLSLQEAWDIDINMALCCCWSGVGKRLLSVHDMEQLIDLCQPWRLNCLLPMRSVRLYLKSLPEASALYDQTKLLELEAERWQQDLMYQWLQSLPCDSSTAEAEEQILINLQAYTQCLPQLQWQQVEPLYREILIYL